MLSEILLCISEWHSIVVRVAEQEKQEVLTNALYECVQKKRTLLG